MSKQDVEDIVLLCVAFTVAKRELFGIWDISHNHCINYNAIVYHFLSNSIKHAAS